MPTEAAPLPQGFDDPTTPDSITMDAGAELSGVIDDDDGHGESTIATAGAPSGVELPGHDDVDDEDDHGDKTIATVPEHDDHDDHDRTIAEGDPVTLRFDREALRRHARLIEEETTAPMPDPDVRPTAGVGAQATSSEEWVDDADGRTIVGVPTMPASVPARRDED